MGDERISTTSGGTRRPTPDEHTTDGPADPTRAEFGVEPSPPGSFDLGEGSGTDWGFGWAMYPVVMTSAILFMGVMEANPPILSNYSTDTRRVFAGVAALSATVLFGLYLVCRRRVCRRKHAPGDPRPQSERDAD